MINGLYLRFGVYFTCVLSVLFDFYPVAAGKGALVSVDPVSACVVAENILRVVISCLVFNSGNIEGSVRSGAGDADSGVRVDFLADCEDALGGGVLAEECVAGCAVRELVVDDGDLTLDFGVAGGSASLLSVESAAGVLGFVICDGRVPKIEIVH